jgi:hypothetical protein
LTIKGKDLDLVEVINLVTLWANKLKIRNRNFGNRTGNCNSTVATLVTFSTKTIDTPEFSYVKPKLQLYRPST